MATVVLASEIFTNPLDVAEMVILDRDWSFDRLDDGELAAEVSGVWSKYRMWFAWQEDLGGLTLTCSFDGKTPRTALPRIHALLALVNEKLWLGHFEINSEESTVVFRHSLLLRGGASANAEQLQDLLDIALQECERFYPAFQAVAWGGKAPAEALEIALFETIAEA